MPATSINDLPCFDGGKHLEGFGEKLHICVSIFRVHNLEDSADSISSNLSDLEEDYYLLLYPLFSPASNYTPLWQHCAREAERPKRNWQMGQYLTSNKSYIRTSSNYCMHVMQRQSWRLIDCQHIRKQKLFLLHDCPCQLKWIFQVFSMQNL